ncbi:MAG: VWA domain-containing protein [Planctomycetes bacterium]|nr:VWA domain-containing protein [Planctomycetota bacterium]
MRRTHRPPPSFHVAAGALLVLATAVATPSRAEDADPFGPVRRPAAPDAADADEARAPDVAAYRAWLARPDWLCRALAARELRFRSDDGVVAALTPALARERDPRVVALLLAALDGRPRDELLAEGGVALAERLVALLDAPQASVRTRALSTLSALPPVRLPRETDALRAWWAKGRLGLEVEARLVAERAARTRAQARPPAGLAPGETVTVAPLAVRRYAELDRIAREGLEVVVCLDETASMLEVIDAAKAGVRDLLARLRDLAPQLRVGLVTYRDEARLRVRLTPDVGAFERALARVVADGGEDEEEGVDRAVRLALEPGAVRWSRKAVRAVVVLGDAPPHEGDVAPLLRAIRAAREDPLFESAARVDTISAGPGGPDGLVHHFAAIAEAGGGAATRLQGARSLVAELLVVPFGPAWREPLHALLADLDALRAQDDAPRARR